MRCFEYYCMYEKAPERCEIQSRTVDWQVRKYMKAFKERGVKFDYSEENKKLFYELHDEIGSERAYVRPDEQRPRLVPCEKCGVATSRPIEIKGHFFCDKCAKEPEFQPKPPSQPQRTEKKTYKETAEYRRAKMRPHDSRLQLEAIQELQLEGWPIETNQKISLSEHEPDGLLRNIRMTLNVDGVVHEGKESRDERIDKRLFQKGWNSVRSRYKSYSKKAKEQVKSEFREQMKQAYVEKGLELPSAVERGE